jgi:hypothetical protein
VNFELSGTLVGRPMTDHRSRIKKVPTPAGTDRYMCWPFASVWEVSCLTCGDRYLTDGGWPDAMDHARKHWGEHNNAPPITGYYLINEMTTPTSPPEPRQRGPKGPFEFH